MSIAETGGEYQATHGEADDVILMTEEELAQLLGVEELPDVEIRNPRC